ncbi:hypothetical protein KIH77_00110 [Bifidobacterium sp. 82T24]|uniref:hypothetical protein n=1 Tax=Bifidobacterium pluvialisilvae TaxID=2834436 RepID=UPI001C586C6C|nr:hypothetical protein [Bifidobacterium pluvialisilvae]MBW3087147.1 hypothetical protein [Bifidobacterium pluvialisilvae]
MTQFNTTPQSPFGQTPSSPFRQRTTDSPLAQAIARADGSACCPCANVCRDSQDHVRALAASTVSIAQDAADALGQAAAVTWEGKAGERFHRTVRETMRLADALDQGAHATARFIDSAEALI